MNSPRNSRFRLATLLGPTGGWKRRVAVLLTAVGVAGGLALAEGKPGITGLKPQAVSVEAVRLEGFDKANRQTTRFGRLEWRGGVVLTSSSRHFGGWSGLVLDSSGRNFLAVSDAGTWLKGELTSSGGMLTGMKGTRLGPLLSLDGKPLARDRDRDAEAIEMFDGGPGKGTALVAFEANDRIGRFPVDGNGIGAPSQYIALPADIRKVRSLNGIEAVATLRGGPYKGSIVAFSEELLPGKTKLSGWIWTGGSPRPFNITDLRGFDITDAAALPDGSVIILERRFRWIEGVKMRLRLLPAAALKPGATLDGEVLLEADLNQEIDNMEGLAVHASASGETILTLISDDNFNPLLQRTLLMQFALLPQAVTARQP